MELKERLYMLQFSWIGILKILKEIHLHWNKPRETNVAFSCSPWGCLCVPWWSMPPSTLPAFSEWFICSLSCTDCCLCCQHFFPQHLERWRWQVFMGGAAAPARWNPSNCCLLLLFCAEGLWRQHVLYEGWGWVLCYPACSASTLLSVHPGLCPVASLCHPQPYGGDVSRVQHWVSERW